jgi:transcriptional regulator with XRE-family HTH domain
LITTGRDIQTARHALGLSLRELADELRLGRQGHTYLRDIESENAERARLSGPMAIAVECLLRAEGYEIEDGQLVRFK